MDRKRLYEGMVSALGGGPPPGYGIHPEEKHFWTDPVIYRVHPLTGREEAVGGLFHRFWKENVQEILQMYQDKWPHVEIVKTAKKLWERQQEESKKDEEIVLQHKESLHAQRKQNVQEIYQQPTPSMGGVMEHGGFPNPEGAQESPQESPTGGPPSVGQPASPPSSPDSFSQQPSPQGQGLMRGLSMMSDKEYQDRLNDFRGKAYSRDAPAASIQQIHRSVKDKGDLHGLGGLQTEVRRFQKSLNDEDFQGEDEQMKKPKRSFQVIAKADNSGGERPLTADQLRRDQDMSFARKEVGVSNAATTGVHEKDKTEGEV